MLSLVLSDSLALVDSLSLADTGYICRKAYEEISDWHSAQLFRYKLNHYLYMSGWTAVFTVWRICGRITCYAAVLYHDDDRSLDFAVPRGRGVPEYGQISYIHIAPGALN